MTKGWKARTDNKWAVYRGVRELSIGKRVREYGIGKHKVYCHYPREEVRIPEPTKKRVVLFLDGSGLEGQPPMAEAAVVRVKGVGQVTESVVEKMVYGAASHGEVQAVADVVGGIEEDVREVWMAVDAEADMASLRRLASRPLHEALRTGLSSQVYAICHGLEMKKGPLVIHLGNRSHTGREWGIMRQMGRRKRWIESRIQSGGCQRARGTSPWCIYPQRSGKERRPGGWWRRTEASKN